MDTKNQRRSDRVSLSVPILVSWTAISGRHFTEEARTLAISRYGATVVLHQKLAPMQQITIRCIGEDKEASAQVVGQIGQQHDGYVYGVALLDLNVNLWNIEFPPLAESEKAASRLLLECAACQRREVVYLDELQTEVFGACHSLSLPCKQCAGWTVWKLALHGVPAEHNQPGARLPGARRDRLPASPSAPVPRTRNERRHVRVPMKQTACIRHPGLGEEVVRIENVSRGGFRFISPNTYLEGSNIEVAVPYTPGAANIFVPARVVWYRELPRKIRREYGVAYV